MALTLAFSSVALGAQEDAAQFYEDAVTRFDQGDLDGAEIQLKNAMQRSPEYLAAQILFGRVQLAKGRPRVAEEAFATAARLGADRSTIDVLRARTLLQLGRYQVVVDELRPDGLNPVAAAQLQVLRGHALLELGHGFEAEQAFTAARARAPAQAAAGLATLHLRQGRLDAARTEAEAAVAADGDDAEAWNARAAVDHALHNVDAALADYARVLALDPHNVNARLARVGLLLDLDRTDGLVADLDVLARDVPHDPRGLLFRAMWLARGGRLDAARAQLVDAAAQLKAIPNDVLDVFPQLLMVSGIVHSALDERERARDDLTRYLVHETDDVGARKLLGSVYLRLGEPGQALSVLEAARQAAPDDCPLLALLGAAHMARGSYAAATQLFERAVELSGRAPDMLAELATSRLRSGQSASALDELQEAFAAAPGQARAGLTLAVMYLRQGRPADAVAVAERVVTAEPANLTALNLLGLARVLSGDRDGAQRAFSQATGIDPKFLPAHLNLAKLTAVRGDLTAARAQFEALLGPFPDNVSVLFELGRLSALAGQRDEALRWLEKARAVDAVALAPRLALVEQYLGQGDPATALGVAEEALQRNPENLTALEAVGRAQLAVGRTLQAQATFRRMVLLAGLDATALLNVARLQRGAEAIADAVLTLEQAVRLVPQRGDIVGALVQAYVDVGRFDDAAARIEDVRRAQPDSAVALQLAGKVASGRKDFAAAATAYREALKRRPSRELALSAFGALLNAQRPDEAFVLLETWTREHPQDLEALAALGEARLQRREWREAYPVYGRLIEQRPNDPALLNNVAYLLAQFGEPAARDYAARAAELAPDDAAIRDTYGWVLVRQGDYAQGLQQLREAESRAAGNPEVHYHIGYALWQAGRSAEARRALERALPPGADYAGADEARRLLEDLRRAVN
ncbi:putative PEP-CTERM system TPR-repeat lipoprotein [Plasticicumulans lactativorans]|uniref:Putative PEP-CTERM system TPR-repeat lipoprotein n=1 Tax=Plasticicumulans lactativorans TaxID=1133106 RepID=A0A4R2L9N0_9GAMM|nr:XrtA/PEP-CTERM system TPR-repeat protein PrsT [Plasticicumulans lactativorans]TCO80969.1 putative PEP-CTERM system TPR-repeat lipoprotein [Plasticicumulans lactativorans]